MILFAALEPTVTIVSISLRGLRRLQASLAELPPLCRDAFLLNRIEDLTHAEIAARRGVSVRTIDRYMIKAWEDRRGAFWTRI
jgi:DNA-directed RNA polymerase specialized sigma24 family protein